MRRDKVFISCIQRLELTRDDIRIFDFIQFKVPDPEAYK